jgi:hypothetical protein
MLGRTWGYKSFDRSPRSLPELWEGRDNQLAAAVRKVPAL